MRRSAVAGVMLVLAVAAALATTLLVQQRQPPQMLYEGTSEFGSIRVEERRDGVRLLRIGEGRAVQTAMDPRRPVELQSPYTRVAMVGLALAPRDGAMLFVGLGGGAMPTYVRHVLPGVLLDAVEIDPAIIEVAIRWFGFRPDPQLRVHAADGRAFIEGAPTGSWDVIFLDAFSDDAIPYALATREFLESVRSRLTGDGVVVSNLWTSNPLYDSMVATYRAVFEEMALVRVSGRAQVILLASDGMTLDSASIHPGVRRLQAEAQLGFDLASLVEQGFDEPPAGPAAPILEDRTP
jgi:spermidine synthase